MNDYKQDLNCLLGILQILLFLFLMRLYDIPDLKHLANSFFEALEIVIYQTNFIKIVSIDQANQRKILVYLSQVQYSTIHCQLDKHLSTYPLFSLITDELSSS